MAAYEGLSPEWRPEEDGDYGRHLVGHLLSKFKWLMLLCAFIGALAFGIVSLFQPRVYSTMGTIFVDKSGGQQSSLLQGIPLLGGGESLDNEIQIITSRSTEWPVIDRLNLNVDIIDLQPADSPLRKIAQILGQASPLKDSREELFSRLRLHDVHVDPELLEPVAYELEGTQGGGWKVGSKRGNAGEPCVLDHVSFTPEFGSAHEPGFRYALVVKPKQVALKDFDDSLSVSVSASVMKLTFRHHNPMLTAEAINALSDEFLQSYERNKDTDFSVILSFIRNETTKLEDRAKELTEELNKYQSENQVYLPSSQGAAAISAAADAEQKKLQNEIQLLNINTVLKNWGNHSPEEISESIQAPATALPIEETLVQALATAIARLKKERLTKTELHPDIISLRAQISTLTGQIRDSLKSARRGLQNAQGELGMSVAEQKELLKQLPEAESMIFNLSAELQVDRDILGTLKKSETDTLLRQASAKREARVLDAALPPVKKDKPRIGRNAVMGAVTGLILMTLLALVLEAANRRIKSLREIRLGAGLPVLGVLPGPKANGVWQPAERNERLLRRLGAFLEADGRTLGLAHLPAGSASFELAWGLARALGATPGSKPTLLIDADRLDLGLCAALGRELPHGLTDAVAGEVPLERCVLQIDEQRWLAQLGAGSLDPARLALAFNALRDWFGAVIICLPPPMQWNSQEQLASLLDDLLLTLPQGSLDLAELRETVADLHDLGFNPRGVVVTNYASKRDVLGRAELRFAAVRPERNV